MYRERDIYIYRERDMYIIYIYIYTHTYIVVICKAPAEPRAGGPAHRLQASEHRRHKQRRGVLQGWEKGEGERGECGRRRRRRGVERQSEGEREREREREIERERERGRERERERGYNIHALAPYSALAPQKRVSRCMPLCVERLPRAHLCMCTSAGAPLSP